MHAQTSTLHKQQMMASTWLGDHQGRPFVPTNSLHELHMGRYQVLLTYLLIIHLLIQRLSLLSQSAVITH